MLKKYACITAALVISTFAALSPLMAAPPLPGAIFTTDSTCSGVDLNIYADKHDVYLNGGPAHPGAQQLPDGQYYVQVTDPSGSVLLGTSLGSGNPTPFVVSGGVIQGCYQLCAIVISGGSSDPDPTCGFDNTPNPGGEYKVWISNESSFTNNSTKTDNFKAPPGGGSPTPSPTPPPRFTLCVDKFYDANVDGLKDNNEVSINGWQIQVFADDNLFISRETYFCSEVPPDSYKVIESTPIETNWLHTTPIQVYTTLPPDQTVEFGNVCLGKGGGLTLGFWSNRNGQALETAADFVFLNGLCLRNATGANQDFIGTLTQQKTLLHDWLLAGNATNMAYMLSVQLTAMELNVRHNSVNGNALLYGGDCVKAFQDSGQLPQHNGQSDGFITVNDLMTAAANELCAHGYTPSGNQFRSFQECMKTTLDNANNNLNFVQATPCPFSFTPLQP
jgi:hypothetical protein